MGFEASNLGDIIRVAKGHFQGCLASQAVEDMFNHAKNSFLVKGKRRFRRPEKSYGAILARKVPSEIHRYTPVGATVPAPRSSVLDRGAFEANPQACSVDVTGLSSTQQTPPWYTAGLEQISRPISDLELFRAAAETGQHRKVAEQAWLGQLCDWKH